MWAIGPKLSEAFSLLKYWGLDFITILFVYNKIYKNTKKLCLGFGHYTRS